MAGLSFAKNTKFSGNPIIEGWYADPQIRIYDNKYWIFPTYSQAFKKQLHLDAYSSDNLENDKNIATGAGHHSVMNIPNTDDWYICYHRRPIPTKSIHHRVVCIDRMYFDKDGKILPIKMTLKGVKSRQLK